ncbi:MAG: hypothetical protein KAT34_09170 [Candidatus Aminicenantes bacterium]|nr:hypothetical protein [Candidatus Aminicenantes bacterium]
MKKTGTYNIRGNQCGKEKILLALLPFWTPLIPPQGISRIKGFLRKYGYRVKTVDVNLEDDFRKLYDKYFNTLRQYIPEHKRGNFYNIGNDVWREHMMAHINYEDEKKYFQLVKILVYKVFYCNLDDARVLELEYFVTEFYSKMEYYFLNLLDKEKPDVLGISVYRDTLPASLFAFKLAKKRYPRIKTIMGGGIFISQLSPNSPNFNFFREKTERFIDKIIIGEGELPFLKFLQGRLPESQRVFTKHDVNGETLGFTPVDMFDFSDFNPNHYSYLAAQGSSSCPNQCSFCNVTSFYGEFKKKNPRQTVEEMIELFQKYGTQLFYMLDALVNEVVFDIAEEFIKSGVSLYWDGYFRVDDACSRENALLWRR